MKRSPKIAFGVGLGVIVLAAGVLSRLQAIQRLGVPGVKIIERKIYREDGVLLGTNSIPLPEQVLGFNSREVPVAKVASDWLPKDTTFAQRLYKAADGFNIVANVVLMGTDRTSIHKPEYCLAGAGLQTRKVEQDTIPIESPHPYRLPIQRMTVAGDGVKTPKAAVYVFWFVADEQLTADHNERMWWMARDLVTRGVLQRWAYVSCLAACPAGQEEATYARIKEWIQASVPQFQITTGPSVSLARNQ